GGEAGFTKVASELLFGKDCVPLREGRVRCPICPRYLTFCFLCLVLTSSPLCTAQDCVTLRERIFSPCFPLFISTPFHHCSLSVTPFRLRRYDSPSRFDQVITFDLILSPSSLRLDGKCL